MFITTTTTNVSGDEADLLTGRFRVQVRDSQRDVNSITESEVRATIQHIILEMQLGTNPGAPVTDLDILSKMVATEFLMVLSFKSDATGKYLIASVLDVKDGSIIRRVESNRIPNSQDFTIEIVDDVAAKVASNPDDAYGRPALFDRLRHEQETPFLPYLKVNLSPAEVQHGGSVTVTAVLREKDAGGALQANRPVTLFHTLPGASTPVRIDGVTDTNGAFVTQLQVGNAPGEGKVNAQFIRRGKVLQDEFASYRVRGTDDLNLSAARAETPAGSSEQVTITLSHFGMPIGGAIVTLSATRGTLDTTTVTTDSNGQATVTFTAGNEGGLANITAQTQLSQTATVSTSMPLAVDSGVDTTLHADANSVYNGVSTQVVSEVLVDGARVPALPVEFSLGGPGTLSADSGVTDENGRISIDYTAPDSGSGSSVVTAVATVDDQEYTRTVTISYGPPQGVCQPPAGASYCVTDLDLGGNSQICARGINNSGQVVGMIGGGGFLWKQGTATTYMTDLLAEDINDAGQVVGRMGTSAVLWQNGSVTNLGSLGGAGGWATAINNAGQVVGYSYEQSDHHAFLWHDGAMQDLGTGVANGINSYGHVVGESTSSTGGAVLWQGGALINLNGSALGSQASDINDAGQIVGQQFRLGELIHATMWDNGSTIDLGSLGSASMAEAINNHGEVVGLAIVSGRWHAFVWKSGVGMQDLNTLIGPNWGWELSRATDINDLGQIVGCSFDQHHIPIRAFLLTPAGR
ncbi:MAG: hypothetical protein FIA90_04170, partial [candidate division NC10 bacterium]|nr:hypothetical protein [candidate division NC10 bacterium]